MSTVDAGSELRDLAYGEAFTETLRQLMGDDPHLFVAGRDIGDGGGGFGGFAGLQAEFGAMRVVDTPASGQAIVGLGIGAAMQGLRPVVDLALMDHLLVAMDQVANQAAKLTYMFGGGATLPLTVTTTGGAGVAAAAQQSQSLEAMLCHVPGLKVVMPSNAHDMKGLLTASIRDDNPVVFIKHQRLLEQTSHCPDALFEIPLGTAAITRAGADVTAVTYGRMVPETLRAATMLAAEDVQVEVIDLRTLQPLDTDTIVSSVQRTHRAVVVHEAVRFAGLGAEIAANVQEHAFDYLDAPVGRVGAPFTPVPFTPPLESAYLPDAADIAEAIRAVL